MINRNVIISFTIVLFMILIDNLLVYLGILKIASISEFFVICFFFFILYFEMLELKSKMKPHKFYYEGKD